MERTHIAERVMSSARSATGAAIAGFTRVLDRVQGVDRWTAICEDPRANLRLSEKDRAALAADRTSAESWIAADPEGYRQDLRRRLGNFDQE